MRRALTGAELVAAFRAAVAACDPARRVAAAVANLAGSRVIGVAIGKAAVAMARGTSALAIADGVIVSPVAGDVAGWRTLVSSHPVPDERSVAAARAVRAVVEAAGEDDVVLALISGGASALVEEPLVPLAALVATVSALRAAGAAIDELNTVRAALSAIKGGGLVAGCAARVVTLVASDVIGDRVELVGSGPTIVTGEPAGTRRERARAILAHHGIAAPAVLRAASPTPASSRPRDRALLVLPMRAFADAVVAELGLPLVEEPLAGDVEDVADLLAGRGPCVAWGEPTLHVPADHGRGGRAQQLALALARRLRGTSRIALVAGTDGADGPGPDAPAGAIVDGTTWDAIAAAHVDPARALARRDAGTALRAVGALVVTGPTGVNHADIAIVG